MQYRERMLKMDGCRKEKSEFFGKICRKINLNFSPRNDEEKLGTQTVTKVRRSKREEEEEDG